MSEAESPKFEEDLLKDRLESEQLLLYLGGFDGPIDMLLALARDQKVDLAKISILALANQYLEFVEKAQSLRLELAADYLVMAAWLAYLKSRLLIPVEEQKQAEPTAQEIADSMQQYGQRPLARLERLGLVNERLTAVHMTQLDPAEIALCAERGVSVVHCPQSNLKLASGFCPTGDLLAAGVNVAIGTDGCASNNDLDMFDELRTAALLAKAVSRDATVFNADQALYAATLGGARAMGLESEIGSLEVGKQADLITVELSALEALPLYDAVSQLVYAGARHWVRDVWIAGSAKLRDRRLVDIDTDRLAANARHWQQTIRQVPRA